MKSLLFRLKVVFFKADPSLTCHLSWVATIVFNMRLLHAVAFSKKLPWFEPTNVISLKTQPRAVNACVKRSSQRSFMHLFYRSAEEKPKAILSCIVFREISRTFLFKIKNAFNICKLTFRACFFEQLEISSDFYSVPPVLITFPY